MENIDLLLLVLLGGGMGLLLIAAAVKYLVDFYSEIKYVKMEMHRAYDWDEYVYWRRELRALRWCIIPGMTVDRVKAIKRNIKSLFVRGKYEKKKEKNDGFISMLLPSVLGICLCAVCLVGGTFAWFTASNNVSTQTIVAADYSIIHKVDGTETTVYTLTKDQTYEITLTADGTAKTGYAILRYGKLDGENAKYNEVHTQAVPVDDTITIKVKPNADCQLQIIAQWGSSTQGEKVLKAWDETDDTVYPLNVPGSTAFSESSAPQESSGNGDDGSTETETTEQDTDTTEEETTVPETTLNPNEYTVKSGDSLAKIAALYSTSVEKLAAYNEIEDPSKIYHGQTIKIPPADWKIPETTTEETTTPTTTEPDSTEAEPEETEPSESDSETTATTETTATPETTAPQETTGTEENPSESDGNE